VIEKIYLDMDGVLTNFESRWAELFGGPPGVVRDRKNFSDEWPQFVKKGAFKTLDWFPGGQELLKYIQSKKVTVEILSSSGGARFHFEVVEQKDFWLRTHGIFYKINIVPGRKFKAEYAKPNVVLIDDTKEIIDSFNAAGGIGILHKDVNITIEKLESLLNT
jgi:hypothetical protein